MKSWRGPLITLSLCAGAMLAGYFGYAIAQRQQYARAGENGDGQAQQGLSNVENISSAFRKVGKSVEPTVVSIQVRKKAPAHPRLDDDMLRRFFPDGDIPEGFRPRGMEPDEEQYMPEQIGTGSGVIMEAADGKAYILTNNHVAGGAEEMLITLNDGRQVRNGKVVGTDAKTDLAVVRIDINKATPARWGNSDEIQKGDWVLAFGSPFGYIGSMTHGIVSAVNRTDVGILGMGGYEAFIQVDAPINPGNSGGPLVNLRGEVIGVNTAIASRTGGFQGIGFAIPSNQAKQIYGILKEKGKVVRGWLGVAIRDVAKYPQMARSFGYKGENGVLVDQIIAGTPAVGRLQNGDIITAINGKPVGTVQQLREQIAMLSPGTDVKMTVFRKGNAQEVTLKLGEQPEDVAAVRGSAPEQSGPNAGASADALGVRVQTLTAEVAEARGLDVRSGAIVTRVDRNSVAAREGLHVGDVITEVGDKPVKTADDFAVAMKKQDLAKGVRMYVVSRDGARYVFIQAEK